MNQMAWKILAYLMVHLQSLIVYNIGIGEGAIFQIHQDLLLQIFPCMMYKIYIS